MKKSLILLLISVLLFSTITSCTSDPNLNLESVVVTNNPKNLLFISRSDYSYSKENIELDFISPSKFGATSYTLEFSDSSNPYDFQTFTVGTTAITTTNPYICAWHMCLPDSKSEGYFRLLINGGEYDGQYSNIEYGALCNEKLHIVGSLRYGIENIGEVTPHVGFDLKANISVINENDDSVLDNLTYKWYRVNPNNFDDKEIISGVTGLSYTITNADINHLIMIVATGDSVKFNGGLIKLRTFKPVIK